MTCTGTTLAPTTFTCVPKPRAPFRFRPIQCVDLMVSGATLTGTAAMSATPGAIDLTTGAAVAETGVAQWGAVSSLGRRLPLELRFKAKVSGSGKDGVWAVLTKSSGMTLAAVDPVIDPTAVVAVELDFFTDAADNDMATAHIAVLYGSVDHNAFMGLKNLAASVGSEFDDGMFKDVAVLFEPVRGDIAVTTWVAGNTMSYDVIPGSVDLRNLLWGPGAVVYPTFVADAQAAGAMTSVRDVRMCGARGPQTWHSFEVVNRERFCLETQALGIPGYTRVWHPRPCPAGVSRMLV